MKTHLPVQDCQSLLDAYREGSLDPCKLVDSLLARLVEEGDRPVWTSRPDQAVTRQRARQLSDALRARGKAVFDELPLFGLPYAVKDNIDVAGLPTTAGCPEFAYLPQASAAAVDKVEAAGAIFLGKTNLDQFATGLTGTRSPYGAIPNPFKPDYISGGSSSGSAAAVALGYTAFALGTDTAGSGRVPAGFCNLVGIKPTPGLVSTRGVFPACRSLDCVSIFAHTVDDGWRVLQTLAGPDPEEPYSRAVPALGPCQRGVRIGVPAPLQFHGDTLAETAFAAARAVIERRPGVTVTPVDFGLFAETAALLYDGPWVAERMTALGDFFERRGDCMDPAVRQVIGKASTFRAGDAFLGLHRLEDCRRRARQVFTDIDLLLVPTAPTHYTQRQIAERPIERNSDLGLYTNFVNLLGLSALALPGLFREDGLPAGITLIAAPGGDHRLAEFARGLEPRLHLRLGTGITPPPHRDTPLPPLPYFEATAKVAVVGAHLRGQPLNWQLTERGGRFLRSALTAPHYRLYSLPGTVPPKPGLIRDNSQGHAIALEVWELPLRHYGGFVAGITAPLSIGNVELEDGERVQGFLCEPWALAGAREISHYGGWLAFLADPSRMEGQ